MRRGLTLVELLVSLIVVALAMAAVSRAFHAGLGFERRYSKTVEERHRRADLDSQIGRLFEGTNLVGSFQSPSRKEGSSLTFTTWSVQPAYAFTIAESSDFEALNERFGPQGGPAEVSLTTQPTGDAPVRQGLFLRIQRPPDGDPTQGGTETLLDPSVQDAQFEFFDGENWRSSWNSQNEQKDKLPKAVRIVLSDREGASQTLLYRLGGAS